VPNLSFDLFEAVEIVTITVTVLSLRLHRG